MRVEISVLQPEHLHVLSNLWQLYIFEGSGRDQIDVDADGRFEAPDGLFINVTERKNGASGYLILCDGICAGFLIIEPAVIHGKPITEFADLFILPKFRGKGVASKVIDSIIARSSETWLIAVFRNDLEAVKFWRSAFNRLPFSSCREVIPPELPDFHEFLINETMPDNSLVPKTLRVTA